MTHVKIIDQISNIFAQDNIFSNDFKDDYSLEERVKQEIMLYIIMIIKKHHLKHLRITQLILLKKSRTMALCLMMNLNQL